MKTLFIVMISAYAAGALGAARRALRADRTRSETAARLPFGREHWDHSDRHWRGDDLSELWADAIGRARLHRRVVSHDQPRDVQGTALPRRRLGAARDAHAQ